MIADAPTLDLLLELDLWQEAAGPAAAARRELYRAAVENLDLTVADYLALRELLALSGVTPEPALEALLLALFQARSEGSLCLPLTLPALRRAFARLAPAPQAEAWAAAVQNPARTWPALATTDAHAYLPLIERRRPHGSFLYFQKYLRDEQVLHERLAALLAEAPLPIDLELAAQHLAAVLDQQPVHRHGQPLHLDEAQQAAIGVCLLQRLAIVSGGPGTGKTAIVANLLRVLVRQGLAPPRLCLAAPTGRAAQRLTESLRQALAGIPGNPAPDLALRQVEARTLHHTLSFNPGANEFRYHAGNPLPADLVLIDEVSMVDVGLMARLLAALAPGTRLILLGDKDQLPSVEAGSVLVDLIPRQARESFSAAGAARLAALRPGLRLPADARLLPLTDHLVILRRSYRANAAILKLAAAVNAGDRRAAATLRPPAPWPDLTPGCRFLPLGNRDLAAWRHALDRWLETFFLAAPAPGEPSYADLLRQLAASPDPAAEMPLLAALFTRLEAARVLTLVRRGPFGCEGVNAHGERTLRSALDPDSRDRAYAGAPIVITRNDAATGLWNGEVGILLRDRQGGYRAVFPRLGQFPSFALDLLPAFEPAFALTVHKSQGSEFDHVLLALPDRVGGRLGTRELLYTAITRARQSVSIAGSAAVLAQTIARRLERVSGLELWPDEPPPPDEALAELPLFGSPAASPNTKLT